MAAEEDKPTANLTVGAYSQYIWRGFELSKDSVVLQPAMTVGYRGFSANMWGNLDTSPDGTDESTSWNETDMTLCYAREMGPAAMTAGYIYYYGLDGMDDSQELFASAAFNVLLRPTLSVYRDIDAYEGWYVTLGVSYSILVSGDITVDLAAQAGYLSADDAETYAGPDNDAYSAFHDGVVSIGMTIPVSKNMTVQPKVSYAFALSSDAESLLRASSRSSDDDSFFYGGVALTFAFWADASLPPAGTSPRVVPCIPDISSPFVSVLTGSSRPPLHEGVLSGGMCGVERCCGSPDVFPAAGQRGT